MSSMKLLLSILLVTLVTFELASTSNNKLNKTVAEMITDSGYPSETHYVTTPDGYILRLHRIPSQRKQGSTSKVIFLQHGLFTCSSDWVLYGPENSLAYFLADQGWDIWMGNARGNVYSRNHTIYNPDEDSKFWQFSWDEIGEIDLPAMIDYVLNITGVDSLYYVGFSQGTTAFYVMASQKPEYNGKIKLQVSLAPVTFINHLASPLLQVLSAVGNLWEILVELIQINEVLPHGGEIQTFFGEFCSQSSSNSELCRNFLFMFTGFDVKGLGAHKTSLLMKHYPTGASVKQLLHYAQEIKSGHFRKYDFGIQGNLRKYGIPSPPSYDLSKVTVPAYLFCGKNDWLADVEDARRLYHGLTNCKSKHLELVKDDAFNHIDFIFGNFAPTLLFKNLINLIAAQ